MMSPCIRPVAFALFFSALAVIAAAQQPARTAKTSAKKPPAGEPDPMAEIRRTTAISLITALADDARGFRDATLRARVQARAADALWETEREKARALFRRAWDEAEAADAESERRHEEDKQRQMRERGSFSARLPPSIRNEVLRLVAKRDRALGEEFLARLDEARKREAESAGGTASEANRQPNDASRRLDPTEAPPAVSKRLRLAIQLLEDGDTERAVQFADPALGQVTVPGLEFLSRLRVKDPKAADERYAALLSRTAGDPSADANTASLLASYIFTPTLYVTFTPDAGSNNNSWGNAPQPPSDIPPQVRAAYFRTAAAILLRPTPTPDQDRSSSGRAGWYMVIARLLPLFDQFAPDRSAALRAKMASLAPDTPEGVRQPGNNALTRGLAPEDPNRDRVQEALGRLDRAKTSAERDAIYVDVVFNALREKDPRLEDFISKIEDTDLRRRVRAYVDFEAARSAVNDKDTQEALRLARAGNLTPIQRTWTLTEVARLLAKSEPGRALEILDEALAEARERFDPAMPERASALAAIATQMIELDRARAWEVMLDVVKASNAAQGYTGEDGRLSVRLQTKNMTMMTTSSAQSFDLAGVFATLAREDLSRAVDLARAFEGESPRAVATLAVARAVLGKDDKK